MRHARTALALEAVALGALSLVACGTDRSVVTTGPSSTVISAVPVTRSSVAPEQFVPESGVNATTPITVGALVSGTSCPNLSFTIGTYVFKVSSSTQYTGGTCASIQPGSQVTFSGARDSETSTVFTIAQLSFVTSSPPPTPTPTPTPINTESTITAIGSGMCPELQFFFGSYAFNVSSATQYSGGTCSDLKAGAKVAVVGYKRDGESFVRVGSLTFRQPTATTPPTPEATTPFSADVTVSSLVTGTACPNLSFMVGPYTIKVSTVTTYENGTCANIAPDSKLKLTGTRQSDGAVAASRIVFGSTTNTNTPGGQPVEGDGVITTLRSGTSCPALEFYIGSYLIQANASTTFDSGACSDLVAGTRVHVKGTLQSDGSVLATRLGVQSQSPGYPVAEGEGRVSNLVSSTTCPALAFMIDEYTVTLNASTTFVGGTCSDVAVGRKLGVKAIMTGEKQALATQIVFRND